MPRRAIAIILFVLSVIGFSGGVWWFSFTAALDPLEERGRADLSQGADRLVGELQRFRQVAVLLSDHPVLVPLAQGGGNVAAAETLLLETADKTGSLEILFASANGEILASSAGRAATRGQNLSGTPYFERAMNGAMGTYHAQVSTTGQRLFYFAVPVYDGGPPLGVIVVKVDLETVEESNWRGDPQVIYFTDDLGVVFVANRSELLLRYRGAGEDEGMLASANAEYPAETLRPFFDFTARQVDGREIWLVDAGRYIPRRALHVTQPLPVIGMTGEVLISTRPAERMATLQAAVAGALLLAFGAFLFLAAERRRSLSHRLELEAATNAELEARVAKRTQELSSVNMSLRREIAEREEAEAALKKAHADLIQAGKLSALGQMSAGISHELNQPLMAIQSFADNGEVFLERGKPETAARNLRRISDLARRMGRIIKNLRAFARQESEPITDVNIGVVIDAVLEIGAARIAQSEVAVDWQPPANPLLVRGGEVRLQQVIMNLVSNAIDAMAEQENKRLFISVDGKGGKVLVEVRDTGPGIDEPEKIFDPFYSTKEVGQSEGMGLGLSISYGLVQSFGGVIRGRNHPAGGAVFTVELTRSGLEKAA